MTAVDFPRTAPRGLWIGLLVMIHLATVARADEYTWDFAGTKSFDNLSLVPVGKGAVNLLRPGKDGLHAHVPALQKVDAVGFSPRFPIEGDFEIALSWRAKFWRFPKTGRGVGPGLYVAAEGEHQPAASLSRCLRPGNKSVYGTFIARSEAGQRATQARLIDTNDQEGVLRLKRTGTRLELAARKGKAGEFQILLDEEFTAARVHLVRVTVQQSDLGSSAEVVFPQIAIQADALPNLPSKSKRLEPLYVPRYEPPTKPASKAWIWQTLLAFGVMITAVVWFRRRYR